MNTVHIQLNNLDSNIRDWPPQPLSFTFVYQQKWMFGQAECVGLRVVPDPSDTCRDKLLTLIHEFFFSWPGILVLGFVFFRIYNLINWK